MMSRIEATLQRHGIQRSVQQLASSTRSVAEAAESLGCTEAQIGKSIVFRSQPSNRAILVVASGVNRISEPKIAALVEETVGKADATFVKERTGYAIGGVPPFGHEELLTTFLDSDLLKYETVYVAAGTPHSVIALSPSELRTLLAHAVQTSVV